MKHSSDRAPLRIAVAGLGTVGVGVIHIVQQQGSLLADRCGRPVEITGVSARNRSRDRGVDLSSYPWFDDPVTMAREAEADLIIELIGGSDGPAKAVCEAAIAAGRHVVTANKALMAVHGAALAAAAEGAGVALAYEAGVAGGIPVVKALREGLAANRITSLQGILNGTSNFILTTMRETGRDFGEVLAEAQELGYAEADPTFDIDGTDAAQKLALLVSLAFGCPVDFDAVAMEGIEQISAQDIKFAEELGYRIKLLAVARMTENGLERRVAPGMVPMSAPMAHVEGVYNAIVTEGDFVGRTVMEGRGAGEGPTASAVVADVLDIAAGRISPVFGVPVERLTACPSAPAEAHVGPYYIRLMVRDRPGVFADIACALRDAQVSMESVLQRGHNPGETVPVVMTVHDTQEAAMAAAIAKINALEDIVEPAMVLRIEPA